MVVPRRQDEHQYCYSASSRNHNTRRHEDENFSPNDGNEDENERFASNHSIDDLFPGAIVGTINPFGHWCRATVLHFTPTSLTLRYSNLHQSYTRRVPLRSVPIQSVDAQRISTPAGIKVNQSNIRVRRPAAAANGTRSNHALWHNATVLEISKDDNGDTVLHVKELDSDLSYIVEFTKDWVQPSSSERMINAAIIPHKERDINSSNSTYYQPYVASLHTKGLTLHKMEGDGNCLFRSVSHQVYGTASHHAVVRKFCMDYMLSQRSYFEPFVTTSFELYVESKRRDGEWGDDVEVQAMCELYNRPAHIWAYDGHSAKMLRTFHEQQTTTTLHHQHSDEAAVIRLSFDFGGHYDSITRSVKNNFDERNWIRTSPGVYESQRLLLLNDSSRAVSVSSLPSSAEAMALQLSRDMFNKSQDQKLEECLKASSDEYAREISEIVENRDIASATIESDTIAVQSQLIDAARAASEAEQIDRAIQESMMMDDTSEEMLQSAMQASLADSDLQAAIRESTSDECDVQRAIQESYKFA